MREINYKEKAKMIGSKVLDFLLEQVCCFIWILYEVVADTIKGIVDFFVAAFFLYIAWGIRLFVIAIILYLITRALGAH